MTEQEALDEALSAHGAFERTATGFETAATAARAEASVVATNGDAGVAVTVRVPTIDAVVAGETVAPVVREGWLETFERRLEHLDGVARGEMTRPTVSVDADAEEVVVELTALADEPAVAAADAKALVDSVEATFVQGLIPGYDYREPASQLLERARSAGER